jgi:hypothetical protein
VIQAHLIVAITHEHLEDGARHELRDGGGCLQTRGGRGGQQSECAGGEGVEVFSFDLGVSHMAIEGRGGFVAGAHDADDLSSPVPQSLFLKIFSRLMRRAKNWAVAGGLGWGNGGCLRRGVGRRGDPALPGVAFEVTSRALGHTSCLSLPGEID